MQKLGSETYQKRFYDFEILQNFPRPTFFEVLFAVFTHFQLLKL